MSWLLAMLGSELGIFLEAGRLWHVHRPSLSSKYLISPAVELPCVVGLHMAVFRKTGPLFL